MNQAMTRTLGRWALLAVALILLGCRQKQSTGAFVPSQGSARQALETTLNAWKAGKPFSSNLEGQSPPINVYESKWQGGQKITGFEIAGEDTNEQNHRRFTVKLTMSDRRTLEVRYVVLGQNTLSVFREEDYLKLSGT